MQQAIANKPEMVTIRQAAQRGILPERTLRRLVAQNKIPVLRSGKTMYLNFTRLCEQLQKGEGEVWE
ncbi:MAG: hypothetical protein FWE32_03695 [Oscillospiraceae bacterium]|nr:hypothetical protein [Oscillospiraceae bacterium]